MKIAYFVDGAPVIGGSGNVLLEQARIMSSVHEVVVVIPLNERGEINSEYPYRCQRANLKYILLEYTTTYCIQFIDIVKAYKDADNIEVWAAEENIDFFHSSQLNMSVEYVSRKMKIPHLMNIYQLQEEEFLLKYIDILPRYHSCDSLLYCSVWRKNLGVKSCCIRPSAPLEHIRKKEKRGKGGLKILMLGGFQERKNQLSAIKAVERCNKDGRNIRLTIAGDDIGEYAEECKRYVRKNELDKDIFIIGFQSEIAPLLLDHDCFLCSSRAESFPSSIVEAMTYDLTIITTPVAGVPELLKDGENAYVSKGYEVEDIVNRIDKCYEDYRNGQIEELQKRAEKLWMKQFSPEVTKEKLGSYYQYILTDYQREEVKEAGNRDLVLKIKAIYDKVSEMGGKYPVVLKRCYYYSCLDAVLKDGTACIWGAGKYGKIAKELLEKLYPNVRILTYIDIKGGDFYQGLPVIYPEQVDTKQFDYCFVGLLKGREEVKDYLQKKGFEYNKNIWLLP